MRNLTPIQVLDILIRRMERRADTLEAVRMDAYNITIHELRHFAIMLRNARDYLIQQQGRHP